MSTPTAPAPRVAAVTPTPADDGEVAAIVAAVRLLLRWSGTPRATPVRSGWRFAGRWWR
ncbi:MAG: OadG family protein [bacterium]|nr:OadG family protein [bacterium]